MVELYVKKFTDYFWGKDVTVWVLFAPTFPDDPHWAACRMTTSSEESRILVGGEREQVISELLSDNYSRAL